MFILCSVKTMTLTLTAHVYLMQSFYKLMTLQTNAGSPPQQILYSFFLYLKLEQLAQRCLAVIKFFERFIKTFLALSLNNLRLTCIKMTLRVFVDILIVS